MVDLYKGNFGFEDLREIVTRLRQPDGCPWDAAQTHASTRKDFLEEVYEVCEAIDRADNILMCEELGDVLWQVAFHTRIAEEEGVFTMDDVITGICKKMIERHPYVFGTVEKPDSAEDTIAIHDAVKAQEKHQRTYTDAMNDVAKTLPALMYANKVQGRAKKSGFDWPSVAGAMDKVREESAEVQACLDKGEDITEELGDLLFAAVNVARMQSVDPEEALLRATQKFMRRFALVEKMAGEQLKTMPIEDMIALWNRAKEQTT
ncbi:MAG: nucleoside triphosphate pyrophosphohydrolase [Clostridia bacterium]|nr:nucleoside triphosphate pyrophosphohydrolase [Clostridia bacterium]